MRKFIVGTDWWTDCDDVVAMRILARAHKRGEICVLGVGLNACMEFSAASLDGFLLSEGVEDIPLGIDLAADDFGRNPPYQKRLASRAKRYLTNEAAEDAVRLYRRLMAAADEKVEIIEIGYPQVLANVLKSGADDISSKTGRELFEEKVEKLWVMAGKWDEAEGRENNFARNTRARRGAHELCSLCQAPVTFLGWEIGYDVITGRGLNEEDPLRQALLDHGSPDGRCSWDPMLVAMALEGDEERAGYETVQGRAFVDAETGCNRFDRCENGMHRYVVRKYDPAYYEAVIEPMIQSL